MNKYVVPVLSYLCLVGFCVSLSPASATSAKQEWVEHYMNGNKNLKVADIAVDFYGNVYITGADPGPISTDPAIVTIKYDGSTGNKEWEAWYEGMGWKSRPVAIAVDHKGNVYVAGYTETELGGNEDYVAIRYDKDGKEVWSSTYNGPGDDEDETVAMALDSSGNVYVTGFSYSDVTDYDYATVKYAHADGNEVWVHRFEETETGVDTPVDIDLDRYGNVYVTGTQEYFHGSEEISYMATIKLVQSGSDVELEWVELEPPLKGYYYFPVAIDIDRYGKVFVAGNAANIFADDSDYFVLKYTAGGAKEWETFYGPGESWDHLVGLGVDRLGHAYVTGWAEQGWKGKDFRTIKLDGSDGHVLWMQHYDGYGLDDIATDIALDRFGNAYVTGYSRWDATRRHYVTIKYDTYGPEEWAYRYWLKGYEEAAALAVDRFLNVVVTGVSTFPWASHRIATVKYSQY